VAVRPTSERWEAAFRPVLAAALRRPEAFHQEEVAAFRQRHPEAYLEASFHRHLEAFHQGASPGPFQGEAAACWQ
jgi:hypothetical protein